MKGFIKKNGIESDDDYRRNFYSVVWIETQTENGKD